jgi:hypothetical protein
VCILVFEADRWQGERLGRNEGGCLGGEVQARHAIL